MLTRAVCSVMAMWSAMPAATLQPSTRFVLASVVNSVSDTPVVGLSAEDFVVQEGTTPCDTIAVRPMAYLIAVLVDTSRAARTEFTQMRKAVRQLVARLSSRDVAIYWFGDRAFRIADFTRDITRLERVVDQLFALLDGDSHGLDAVIEAGKDLARCDPAVAIIIVVSAGANDQSNRTLREVFEQVLTSRSIVHVVEMRSIGASGRLGNVRGRRNFSPPS